MGATKTEFIRARIEPNLKLQVDKILEKLGLNQTEAIRLFYKQIILNKGLPFEVKIPDEIFNEETLQVIKDIEEGKNIVSYDNIEDMIEALKK